jgi:hypothetical protein
MSATSFGRPEASLFLISTSRLTNDTVRPSTSAVARDAQASSNVTPEISVRTSMRPGRKPDLIYRAGLREVGRGHARRLQRRPETSQCAEDALGIDRRRAHEEIAPLARGAPWKASA